MKIIFNGEIITQENSICSDQGWLPGFGIFETIKTVDGWPWAFHRHICRAGKSAYSSSITVPPEKEMREVVDELLRAQTHSLGILRLSFSNNGDWLGVHLPYPQVSSPARLLTIEINLPVNKKPIKSYPYKHRIEILEAIKAKGFDEALIVDKANGHVTEGAVTNLLLRVDGQWITPPIGDGVLPGIVRALVIENCGVKVKRLEKIEIAKIESAFLLNSLRIAQPVASIDGIEIGQSNEFGLQIHEMAHRTSVE